MEVKRRKILTFWRGKYLAAYAGRCNLYLLLGLPEEEGETEM